MANRSRSGPAHLERTSISEEFVHMDRHVRSEVHKEAPRPPSPRPQEKKFATNTDSPSHSSREIEVERLREQVAML
nr:hypothetical protein CFP56_68752 [Quercus suber]